MIGNRYNSDSIAEAFSSILKANREINKSAQALFESPAEDDPDPADAVLGHKPEGDLLPDPESFLMSLEQPKADDISGALDGSIDSLESAEASCGSCGETECYCDDSSSFEESNYFNPTATHILNGLGKIAGSLQSKGHNFASDIVAATAMSIKDDFIKDASRKAKISTELYKMAKDLSDSGNIIASDMVLVTIEKIKKS